MFVIKTALLVFALVVALDNSISYFLRMPLALGAVLLEQILNAYTEIKRLNS